MTGRAAVALVAWLALPGCLDSLVGGDCLPGWTATHGQCQPIAAGPDAGADAAVDVVIDAAADQRDAAPVCVAPDTWCGDACVDLLDDPDHCGACGRACASGLCRDGACLGEVAGHLVVIGHDYTTRRAALDRVLGNAVSLGAGRPLRIARWTGQTAPASAAGTSAALAAALSAMNRTWQLVDVEAPPDRATADVLLVCAQTGPEPELEALGAAWATALTEFEAAGGVVVVLVGPGGSTPALVRGAGLLDVATRAPIDGAAVEVAAPGDAVAIGVPSPYRAMAGSTSLSGGAAARVVVRTAAGDPVVLHAP